MLRDDLGAPCLARKVVFMSYFLDGRLLMLFINK